MYLAKVFLECKSLTKSYLLKTSATLVFTLFRGAVEPVLNQDLLLSSSTASATPRIFIGEFCAFQRNNHMDSSLAGPTGASKELEIVLEGLLDTLLEMGICASDVQEMALEGAPNGVAAGYPGGLLGKKVTQTVDHLARLQNMAGKVHDVLIPQEVIASVDQGKNPHLYTREMIERVAGENMYTNGILTAVSNYRDLLNSQMAETFPEIADLLPQPTDKPEENHTTIEG